ncbi:MAG: T9SS type A sorting domain-containing protein [Rhodothermales bacterium]|nr:T9SS type A sorting domain-containing protein [Rhodothermales bacterium]MBO6778622.1 T9SS type A sorting domain-containing protein [Rhodothermales bacterium]
MRTLGLALLLAWSAPVDARQFALETGNRWEYVTILDPPNAPPDTVGAGSLEVLRRAEGYLILSSPIAGSDSVRWADRSLYGLLGGQEYLLLDFRADSGSSWSIPMVLDGVAHDTMDVFVERGLDRWFEGGSRDVIETPAGYFNADYTFTASARRTLDAGWTIVFDHTYGPVSRIDGHGTLGIVSVARLEGVELPRFHVELTTDKPQYAYGEPIELTLFVRNDTDQTVRLGTFCNAPSYVLGPLAPRFEACILWVDYHEFRPGSNRTWTWRHDPRVMGMPAGGTHRLTAFYAHAGGSVEFEAPEFQGGWLSAEIAHFLPAATEEAIRTDLRAEVVRSIPRNDGSRSEVWALTEISPEEALRRHGAQTGLRLSDMRLMYLTDIRSTEVSRAEVPEKTGLQAYPNPVTADVVHFDGLLPGQEVQVFDLLGRRVATAGRELDTSQLGPGLYVFRVGPRAGTFVVAR